MRRNFKLFIGKFSRTGSGQLGLAAATSSGVHYIGVTAAACELLQVVDAGGVPAFVTNNLKQIAEDNGIEVTIQSTPNEIVDAIRDKASEALCSGPPD